jgi:hypothetical protein
MHLGRFIVDLFKGPDLPLPGPLYDAPNAQFSTDHFWTGLPLLDKYFPHGICAGHVVSIVGVPDARTDVVYDTIMSRLGKSNRVVGRQVGNHSEFYNADSAKRANIVHKEYQVVGNNLDIGVFAVPVKDIYTSMAGLSRILWFDSSVLLEVDSQAMTLKVLKNRYSDKPKPTFRMAFHRNWQGDQRVTLVEEIH